MLLVVWVAGHMTTTPVTGYDLNFTGVTLTLML